jgi:predicted NAD-dependent protein-ADP-ribosyltransferase YbiA (DUF1768 family)
VRALFKDAVLVLVAEDDDERAHVRDFLDANEGHVFALEQRHDRAIVMSDLGAREDACREPINIGSRVTNRDFALISNFAATPFELDGRCYASIEGFWQSLRFPDDVDRVRVAALSGVAAKRAGAQTPWGVTFAYDGASIAVGRPDHWRLMERACEAKFAQNARAGRALLTTGSRPLTHRVRVDSQSIPGVIMAGIWMRVRERMRS